MLRQAEAALAAEVARLAAAEGVTVTTRSLARFEPVDFDPATVDLVEATAQRLGHSTRRMPSGAGHDAQMLARICPAAMIFTPSVGGLSHNIAEHTHPADVTAGADVLLQTAPRLDRLAQATPHGSDTVGGPRWRSPRAATPRRHGDAGRPGAWRDAGGGRPTPSRRSVTVAHASAGERWAASTISAAVSNGHARPSGLNGSCRLSAPAATTTPASRSARTAVSPRGIACWWSRPWR